MRCPTLPRAACECSFGSTTTGGRSLPVLPASSLLLPPGFAQEGVSPRPSTWGPGEPGHHAGEAHGVHMGAAFLEPVLLGLDKGTGQEERPPSAGPPPPEPGCIGTCPQPPWCLGKTRPGVPVHICERVTHTRVYTWSHTHGHTHACVHTHTQNTHGVHSWACRGRPAHNSPGPLVPCVSHMGATRIPKHLNPRADVGRKRGAVLLRLERGSHAGIPKTGLSPGTKFMLGGSLLPTWVPPPL